VADPEHVSKWNRFGLKLNPGRDGVSSSPCAEHIAFVFAVAGVVVVAFAVVFAVAAP